MVFNQNWEIVHNANTGKKYKTSWEEDFQYPHLYDKAFSSYNPFHRLLEDIYTLTPWL